MKNELRQWLQLSLKEKIPASLLILSRAFNITGAPQEKALETTLSYLPEDVIQESTVKIIEELKTDEFEKQLEIIKREEELIKLEKKRRAGKCGRAYSRIKRYSKEGVKCCCVYVIF